MMCQTQGSCVKVVLITSADIFHLSSWGGGGWGTDCWTIKSQHLVTPSRKKHLCTLVFFLCLCVKYEVMAYVCSTPKHKDWRPAFVEPLYKQRAKTTNYGFWGNLHAGSGCWWTTARCMNCVQNPEVFLLSFFYFLLQFHEQHPPLAVIAAVNRSILHIIKIRQSGYYYE